MRSVGIHRGARTIGLALVAGLVAFEAGLWLSTGALGIPGVVLIPLGEGKGGADQTQVAGVQDGGETVITKLPQIAARPEQTVSIKPPVSPPAPVGEQKLSGLSDEPSWDRDHVKPDKPTTVTADSPTTVTADSGGTEVLPWDAVEPVPFDAGTPASAVKPSAATALAAAPQPTVQPVHLPESREVEGWVKAKATEIKGEDRGTPLYHIELWLEPPEQVKQRLVAVAYDFNTPAVVPQSQISSEQETGFRVSVGGLACADEITVTLRFNDGQSQQVAVDGCKLRG
jgi:hypothetical protein